VLEVAAEGGGRVRVLHFAISVILKDVPGVRRFQVVQRAGGLLELRLAADDPAAAFARAREALGGYLGGLGAKCAFALSPDPPRPDPVSGKFNRVIREKPPAGAAPPPPPSPPSTPPSPSTPSTPPSPSATPPSP
jgi:hypothetical protein